MNKSGGRSAITPLFKLERLINGRDISVWAKLEHLNPGGSAKDRTAKAMVAAAQAQGRIYPGATVVESSSGNLGVALARQATLGGWTFHCVVDPKANRATIAHMKAFGAIVHEVTEPDPETGDWLAARKATVAKLLEEIDGAIGLDQYSNEAAFTAHCEGTMREIVEQLGHAPDFLVVAVSTTGTIGGCIRYIEQHRLHTQTVAVDAEGSVLFGGQRGDRYLPGFGAGVVPKLAESVTPDRVIRIADRESVEGARQLAKTEAILPGASGGAVIAALEKLLPDVEDGAEIVVILHDGGAAYLDTVYNDDWVKNL